MSIPFRLLMATFCLQVVFGPVLSAQIAVDDLPAFDSDVSEPVKSSTLEFAPADAVINDDHFEGASDEGRDFVSRRQGGDEGHWRETIDPSSVRVMKNGAPVTDALVVGYLGYPIEVTRDAEGEFQAQVHVRYASETGSGSGYWKAISGADGSLSPSKPELELSGPGLYAGQSVLAVHTEAGYGTAILTPKDGICEIQLQDWSLVSQQVTAAADPSARIGAVARWESFPHAPSLLNRRVEERRQGPGLFSLTLPASPGQVAPSFDSEVDAAGSAEEDVLLPEGRLRFTALVEKPSGGFSHTNIHRWQSVQSGQNELESWSVDPLLIKGRLKLTDEVLEKITRVERAANGSYSITRASLALRVVMEPEADRLFSEREQTLEEAIRTAAVWGRSGGQREHEVVRSLSIHVRDSDGYFEAILQNRDYKVTGVWMLEGATSDPEAGAIEKTRLTQIRDVSITAYESDPNGMSVVDLGEVDPGPLAEFFGSSVAAVEEVFGAVDADTADLPAFLDAPDDPQSAEPQPVPADSVDSGRSRNTWKSRDDSPPGFVAPPLLDGPSAGVLNPGTASFGLPTDPTVDPVDRSISELITRILSAGDQRTRENLREPLQKLLTQKFDAEQKAREELVAELERRLQEASGKVKERARRRDEIIGQQVQRMLGLPLDDFEPLNEVEPVDDIAPSTQRSSLSSPDIAPESEPTPDVDRFQRS